MITNRLTRAAAASVAAIAVGLTALAAPARADVLVDDDPVFIIGTNVSFGSIAINPGPFAMTGDAQPGGSGTLYWWSDAGDIQPHLVGYMWTQRIGGSCAKMRMQYYDANDVLLATRGSGAECPVDDDFEIDYVNMAPYANRSIVRVVVSTTTENLDGRFVINNSQTFDLN